MRTTRGTLPHDPFKSDENACGGAGKITTRMQIDPLFCHCPRSHRTQDNSEFASLQTSTNAPKFLTRDLRQSTFERKGLDLDVPTSVNDI